MTLKVNRKSFAKKDLNFIGLSVKRVGDDSSKVTL